MKMAINHTKSIFPSLSFFVDYSQVPPAFHLLNDARKTQLSLKFLQYMLPDSTLCSHPRRAT